MVPLWMYMNICIKIYLYIDICIYIDLNMYDGSKSLHYSPKNISDISVRINVLCYCLLLMYYGSNLDIQLNSELIFKHFRLRGATRLA